MNLKKTKQIMSSLLKLLMKIKKFKIIISKSQVSFISVLEYLVLEHKEDNLKKLVRDAQRMTRDFQEEVKKKEADLTREIQKEILLVINKVAQEEALAESYGEIANESKSLDDDIEAAIGDSSQTKAASDLEALKAKMGLNNPE